MTTLKFSLAQLAQELKSEFRGDPNCEVHALATLESAVPGTLSFLGNIKYLEKLKNTQASIVIIPKDHLEHCKTNAIICDNVYYALSIVAEKFNQEPPAPLGIHPSAIIGDLCHIKISASVGPHVVLGENVSLGEGVRLDAGVVIGSNVTIGDHTHIYPNVSVYHGVTIGQRCIIHSGAIIGADGFGMAPHEGQWYKIPQIGRVVIGNDVEVGANTTIDRGAIDNTKIGDGVKLDNQIQVGHNVEIGAHTVIAGCTAIAGSTKIGQHVLIGGGSSIAGHLTIVDGTVLLGQTQVGFSIETPGTYSTGFGCLEKMKWARSLVQFYKLPELATRIKTIEKKLSEEDHS